MRAYCPECARAFRTQQLSIRHIQKTTLMSIHRAFGRFAFRRGAPPGPGRGDGRAGRCSQRPSPTGPPLPHSTKGNRAYISTARTPLAFVPACPPAHAPRAPSLARSLTVSQRGQLNEPPSAPLRGRLSPATTRQPRLPWQGATGKKTGLVHRQMATVCRCAGAIAPGLRNRTRSDRGPARRLDSTRLPNRRNRPNRP